MDENVEQDGGRKSGCREANSKKGFEKIVHTCSVEGFWEFEVYPSLGFYSSLSQKASTGRTLTSGATANPVHAH